MRIGGIRADVQVSCQIFNKQLIDLMIFEVFLYLDDTINNNDDNVQEVEKNTEVCRDLFRLQLVFFIFQDASYNLRMVIFNRAAFRQMCCPNLIQPIIPRPGLVLWEESPGLPWVGKLHQLGRVRGAFYLLAWHPVFLVLCGCGSVVPRSNCCFGTPTSWGFVEASSPKIVKILLLYQLIKAVILYQSCCIRLWKFPQIQKAAQTTAP